jgi:hypothetical protein
MGEVNNDLSIQAKWFVLSRNVTYLVRIVCCVPCALAHQDDRSCQHDAHKQ